jgi:phenylpyruvate tautomerase PptA (4-oxalocrotonate tautomerase family)
MFYFQTGDSMPTYTVSANAGRLSRKQKSDLAFAITDIHCKITGAPAYFAQVIFNDIPEGNYFIAGKPLRDDVLFVHGQIRAGRDLEVKHQIIMEILDASSKISNMHMSHIQVYIIDVPAKQIAEWGKILPNPDEQTEWFDSISDDVKKRMLALL